MRRRSGIRPLYQCRILRPRIRDIRILLSRIGPWIPDDWGYFLCKVWDDWYHRDIGKVFVNHFETAVAQWKGMDSQLCIYHEFCGKGVALEHDGNLYSVRSLCVSRIQIGKHSGNLQLTDGFLRATNKFGFAKLNSLPSAMRGVQLPFCMQWGVPQEPRDSNARRRAGAELFVQRIAEILAAHRSRRERHLPAVGARRAAASGLRTPRLYEHPDFEERYLLIA